MASSHDDAEEEVTVRKIAIAAALVAGLLPRPAYAQLQEVRQSILGMD